MRRRQGLGDSDADAPGGSGDQSKGARVGCGHRATVPVARLPGRRLIGDVSGCNAAQPESDDPMGPEKEPLM